MDYYYDYKLLKKDYNNKIFHKDDQVLQKLIIKSDKIVQNEPKNEPKDKPKDEPIVETQECVICMDSQKNTAFVPCGHIATCDNCSMTVKSCPICRADAVSTLRVYHT